MANRAFDTITRYYAAVWGSLDFDAFAATISPTAQIWCTCDGMNEKMTVKEFLVRMRVGHFENTTEICVKSLNISGTTSPVFKVQEEAEFKRLGKGMNETEPGWYSYHGHGTLTVGDDDLINNIRYEFIKTLKK